MMGDQQAAGNPIKAALDATTKLWENVIRANPKMGPYVQRAMAILNAGIEAAQSAAPGGGGPPKTEGGNQAENAGVVPRPAPAGPLPG